MVVGACAAGVCTAGAVAAGPIGLAAAGIGTALYLGSSSKSVKGSKRSKSRKKVEKKVVSVPFSKNISRVLVFTFFT